MDFILRLLQFIVKIVYNIVYVILNVILPRKKNEHIPAIKDKLLTIPLVEIIQLMRTKRVRQLIFWKSYNDFYCFNISANLSAIGQSLY